MALLLIEFDKPIPKKAFSEIDKTKEKLMKSMAGMNKFFDKKYKPKSTFEMIEMQTIGNALKGVTLIMSENDRSLLLNKFEFYSKNPPFDYADGDMAFGNKLLHISIDDNYINDDSLFNKTLNKIGMKSGNRDSHMNEWSKALKPYGAVKFTWQ